MAADTPASSIVPRLKTFDLTMIVAGLVIGMGIFRVPAEVAQKAGIPLIFFAAWITGAAVSLIGALTFAEIGSRYPVAGGFYKIFSHCYHPCFAFMVNWIIVVSNAGATAGVAIMGADYIAPILLPTLPHETAVKFITISSLGILYVVNMIGIRVSARLLNSLMVIKIGMLLLLISAVFILPAAPIPAGGYPAPTWGEGMKAFTLCFIPLFFSYGGYQQTINFGKDIPNAKKTLPRAVWFGISLILFLYLSVNYSYYKVLGFDHLQHTTTIASDMVGLLFGPTAYRVVSVVMLLSVMAYVNVSVLSNPRIYFAMAEDGVLPPIFKRLNPKTQVQEFALTVFCLFIFVTLFFISSFQKILDHVMFFDSISLIAAGASIFVLRSRAKKTGDEAGIFKIKGYPYLPAFFILIYATVIGGVFYTNISAAISGFVLFFLGYPLYYFIKFALKKRTAS